MLKYLTKIAMDILPSVAATIIGAWVVNHYIVSRPAVEAPPATVASPASPKKADAKVAATPANAGNIPEPGVKAKGISERAMLEQTAAERPAMAEKPAEKAIEKPVEKSADLPAETASIPADARRHPLAPREKAVAKAVPAQVAPAPSAVAVAPVVAPPNTAPSAEASTAPDDRRDANDLARAAIERLRSTPEAPPRPQEAARVSDAPRVAPVASAQPVRPLPPPIMVSTPAAGTYNAQPGAPAAAPTYPAGSGIDDPSRPIPPADIPEASPPLDLRAEVVVVDPPRREHTNVAQDMLLAAKSVFHAVLPK